MTCGDELMIYVIDRGTNPVSPNNTSGIEMQSIMVYDESHYLISLFWKIASSLVDCFVLILTIKRKREEIA